MSDDATLPWSTLLSDATDQLAKAGIETAAIDARRIVEEVAGSLSGSFHSVLAEPATVGGVARFDVLVSRRQAGEPLQYVLGRWGFRSLDLMVDARVLIPRPETEVVAGLAIDEVRSRSVDREVLVADLGTGSGAIALAVATECGAARVLAADRSEDAIAVARANLVGIGGAATRVSLHVGDWFDALPSAIRGNIDVVVSNPPYVADADLLPEIVENWEPASALRSGPDGLDDLRQIVDVAPDWLAPGGALVLEMASPQTDVVADWCRVLGFRSTIHEDLAGRPRAVVARMDS